MILAPLRMPNKIGHPLETIGPNFVVSAFIRLRFGHRKLVIQFD